MVEVHLDSILCVLHFCSFADVPPTQSESYCRVLKGAGSQSIVRCVNILWPVVSARLLYISGSSRAR